MKIITDDNEIIEIDLEEYFTDERGFNIPRYTICDDLMVLEWALSPNNKIDFKELGVFYPKQIKNEDLDLL